LPRDVLQDACPFIRVIVCVTGAQRFAMRAATTRQPGIQ
jgi:hypothetical protein